jgi:hypothetical protein
MLPSDDAWPPDDTEESVLGIDLHQETITNVRLGVNGAARLSRAPEQPVPWQAETQLLLLGCKRPDGTGFRTLPDVFVFPRPIDPLRGSFSLKVDGPPLLVIEVLSEFTAAVDLDLKAGKGYSYARAGVPEYLTIDPTGDILDEGIRAWRLEDGVYQPWEADGQGRWRSRQISVAITLEGMWVAVYTHDGRRMLREIEVEETLARERQLRGQAEAEVERLRRLLEEQRQ